MLLLVLAMASVCNYNPDVLDVNSKPKAWLHHRASDRRRACGKSYAGRHRRRAPSPCTPISASPLRAEAVVTVPKNKQAQSVQVMGHLLDRLGSCPGRRSAEPPRKQSEAEVHRELAVNRGVTPRVYHYEVQPNGGVVISGLFSSG